jgi:hypothetical protein
MAQQQNALSEIGPILLIGGAAWVAWLIYQSYQATYQATAAPATPATPAAPATTQTPAAPAPAASPAIVIPAGFTVTPDVNNSYRGTVTYNGSPATLNVILANAGDSTGVVYNSAGTDVTALLGAANVATLVNAYQIAANNLAIGGAVAPATGIVIPVPAAVSLQRLQPVPIIARLGGRVT